LILRTVTVSVRTTVNVSVQLHSGLLPQQFTMNCIEPPSSTNHHPFLSFRCPTSFQKPSVVCRRGCFLHAFSWVSWRRM